LTEPKTVLQIDKENEKQLRQELIDYIVAIDGFYADQKNDNYSTTSLVIIKTEIQIDKLKKEKENDNR
jgi:hypothetical protein